MAPDFEQFARELETNSIYMADKALSESLCCNGYMCGCQGASIGEYLASLVRDMLTAHATPSARITGDKDRENPVEGAPYGEGLIGRIDQLEHDLALARRGWAYAQGEQVKLAAERTELRAALEQIEVLPTNYSVGPDDNMERARGIARHALKGPSNER